MSSRSCVTRFGITDPQTKLRLHTSRFPGAHPRIFASDIKYFSSSSGTNASRPASLISSSNLSFNFSHSEKRRIPIVRSLLGNPKESIFQGTRSFEATSAFFLLSSAQMPSPRVGDIVICLTTRESHECCVHLLQHELYICTLHAPRSRWESKIDQLCRHAQLTTPTSSRTP